MSPKVVQNAPSVQRSSKAILHKSSNNGRHFASCKETATYNYPHFCAFLINNVWFDSENRGAMCRLHLILLISGWSSILWHYKALYLKNAVSCIWVAFREWWNKIWKEILKNVELLTKFCGISISTFFQTTISFINNLMFFLPFYFHSTYLN